MNKKAAFYAGFVSGQVSLIVVTSGIIVGVAKWKQDLITDVISSIFFPQDKIRLSNRRPYSYQER